MIPLKQSVRQLKPYFVNQIPYTVKLDANETKNYLLNQAIDLKDFPFHIYPDSDAIGLREKLANYYGCQIDEIIVGNGSSDMINLVINGFCEKEDSVLGFTPSFSMYDIYCQFAQTKYVTINSNEDYSVSVEKLIDKAKEIKPKVIILCNPNNPTGYYIEKDEVIKVLDQINEAIIILDEAYIDFGGDSCVDLINTYPNLIVMRTLSKAFGLASLRVGCLITNKEMQNQLWAIKVPYNLNAISQWIAEKALEQADKVEDFVVGVATERELLRTQLELLGFKVFPSRANFLFVAHNHQDLFTQLNNRGILIRKIKTEDKAYYRISIGDAQENQQLIRALEEIL